LEDLHLRAGAALRAKGNFLLHLHGHHLPSRKRIHLPAKGKVKAFLTAF